MNGRVESFIPPVGAEIKAAAIDRADLVRCISIESLRTSTRLDATSCRQYKHSPTRSMRCDRTCCVLSFSQLGYRKFNRPLEQRRFPVLTLRANADLERTEGAFRRFESQHFCVNPADRQAASLSNPETSRHNGERRVAVGFRRIRPIPWQGRSTFATPRWLQTTPRHY